MVKSIPGTGSATPMLATQVMVQPPPAATRTPAAESPSVPHPQVQSAVALPPRLFPVYSRFMLDLEAVPVIGAPTNAQVIVSLFDYTCHHCRLMHPLLIEAQRTFSNELVIASLPMPLDPQCNHTVKVTTPDHSNACEYARLGLAVWRADRSKHRQFDDWMFATERPPPATEARDYATQLVGENKLTAAWQDPWLEQQLKLDVLMYELAYRFGQGSMPQLIVGSNVAVGTFPRGELLQLLEKNLGLKKL
jgi:protein-disulfide isomerase